MWSLYLTPNTYRFKHQPLRITIDINVYCICSEYCRNMRRFIALEIVCVLFDHLEKEQLIKPDIIIYLKYDKSLSEKWPKKI